VIIYMTGWQLQKVTILLFIKKIICERATTACWIIILPKNIFKKNYLIQPKILINCKTTHLNMPISFTTMHKQQSSPVQCTDTAVRGTRADVWRIVPQILVIWVSETITGNLSFADQLKRVQHLLPIPKK